MNEDKWPDNFTNPIESDRRGYRCIHCDVDGDSQFCHYHKKQIVSLPQHDKQMREEGAKAERERWQVERDKLIAVIDEKIANARVAATNKVLDELAQMYVNIPEQFLKGTYRLHSEWKAKIESLHITPSKQEHKS